MKLIKSLFLEKNDHMVTQLLRYTFVGGLAFLVDFGSLYICTQFLGFHFLVSATIGFILGLITNYFLSVSWVFSMRKIQNWYLEFTTFAFIGLLGLLLNNGGMWILTEKLGIYYLISKIINTIFVYLFNFFARKFIIF